VVRRGRGGADAVNRKNGRERSDIESSSGVGRESTGIGEVGGGDNGEGEGGDTIAMLGATLVGHEDGGSAVAPHSWSGSTGRGTACFADEVVDGGVG
jgi:hypothetical protein